MYYVRKLNNPPNWFKLKSFKGISEVYADLIGQEVRTKENTLSLWKCNDIKNPEDTIKAILLSGNKVVNIQLVFIEESLFEKYNVDLEDTDGVTAYDGYESLHTDAIELTYESIGSILHILTEATKDDENGLKLLKTDVMKYISDAASSHKINIEKLNPELKKILNNADILTDE